MPVPSSGLRAQGAQQRLPQGIGQLGVDERPLRRRAGPCDAVLDARAPRSATAPVGRPANAVLMAQH